MSDTGNDGGTLNIDQVFSKIDFFVQEQRIKGLSTTVTNEAVLKILEDSDALPAGASGFIREAIAQGVLGQWQAARTDQLAASQRRAEQANPLLTQQEVSAEELAAAVKISPSLQALTDGDPIDKGEAIKTWIDRVGDKAMYNIGSIIYDSLPAELRTKQAIAALDLRPYLQLLRGARIPNVRPMPSKNSWSELAPWNQGDAPPSDTERVGDAEIDQMLIAENKRIRDTLAKVPDSSAADADTRKAMLDAAASYTPGQASALPETQQDVLDRLGKGTVNTSAAGPAKPWDPSETVRFPVDQLRNVVQTGEVTDFNQFLGLEQQQQSPSGAGGGYFPVTVGEPGNPYLKPSSGETISARDAANYLQRFGADPAKVTEAQRKLAEAGYFDRIGKGAADIAWGDAFDPTTQEAWKAMLLDVVRRDTTVPELLRTESATYRERVRQQRLAALTPYQETGADLTANSVAQSVIGRDLSPFERAALAKHIAELRSQRAGYIGGDRNGTPLPNAAGFTADDIQSWVTSRTSEEQLMTNSQQLTYAAGKTLL